MHGQYTRRNNLAQNGYYDKMAEYGIVEASGDSFEAFNYNNFYYYCACVMEFDRALGEIVNQLSTRENSDGTKLIDNTIICLFGDHNTYYSSLSNYVKGVNNTKDDNYTNLFRVPMMIKYPKLDIVKTHIQTNMVEELAAQLMTENELLDIDVAMSLAEQMVDERFIINNNQIVIKKFMCTADIVPTLFDLVGINIYGNLYFGHSAFEWQQSVLYSRAYDIFITDNMYFVSLNNIKYIRKDNPVANNDPALKYADISRYDSEEHIIEVEIEAQKLLNKLSVCNRLFYNDYWSRKNINDSSKTNAQIFVEKLKEIN